MSDPRDGFEEPIGSGGHDAAFPTFACALPAPKAMARTLSRALAFIVLCLAALALWAHENGRPLLLESAALAAGVVLGVAIPAGAFARQLARYPDRCPLVLGRDGFRLPWLHTDAPGPEGPWEALRGFRVARGAGPSRILIFEVAAGRLAISDRSIGAAAFEGAVAALERALGPSGVLLGSVVRLPIHVPDLRPLWARVKPALPAVGLSLFFVALAVVASSVVVKVLSSTCAVLWILGHVIRGFERLPSADLALGLDGLAAPLPGDPRRTVKVRFEELRRTAVVEEEPDRYSLVIEHDRGRLSYPLEWLDPRHARAFAKELAARRGA